MLVVVYRGCSIFLAEVADKHKLICEDLRRLREISLLHTAAKRESCKPICEGLRLQRETLQWPDGSFQKGLIIFS
jgi:hypothetical protein